MIVTLTEMVTIIVIVTKTVTVTVTLIVTETVSTSYLNTYFHSNYNVIVMITVIV